MAIHSIYDTSASVLSPSHMVEAVSNCPQVMIAVFQEKVRDYFLQREKMKKIGDIRCGILHPVYVFEESGAEIAFLCSPIGGAASVLTAEKAAAMGVKHFVFYGSCGILTDRVLPDRIFVPTQARRDEGTSYHYMPSSEYIDVPGNAETIELLRKLSVPFQSGRVWTTDAIFRETRNQISQCVQEGCFVVDMECASLAAWSKFRGYDCRYFLFSADSLAKNKWRKNNLSKTPPDLITQTADLAIALAKSMV